MQRLHQLFARESLGVLLEGQSTRLVNNQLTKRTERSLDLTNSTCSMLTAAFNGVRRKQNGTLPRLEGFTPLNLSSLRNAPKRNERPRMAGEGYAGKTGEVETT